jgi:predicted transport protein
MEKREQIVWVTDIRGLVVHIEKAPTLQNSLKLFINAKAGQLDDPKKLAQDVSNIGHWGNGVHQIQVEENKDLEYIMSLVKQVIV